MITILAAVFLFFSAALHFLGSIVAFAKNDGTNNGNLVAGMVTFLLAMCALALGLGLVLQ